MFSKILKKIQKLCDLLEICVALFIVAALLITFVKFVPELKNLFFAEADTKEFINFLGHIFNLVVGIEFIKLLCKPDTDNTFEVLIFLVARHMIVGTNSSVDMFLSIVGIAILCVVRRLIHLNKHNQCVADQERTEYRKEEPQKK